MKTAASAPQNARFMIKPPGSDGPKPERRNLRASPCPPRLRLLKRRAWPRPCSRCKTSISPSAARRCSKARSFRSASASACAWSGATARASRRCSRSPPGFVEADRGTRFAQPGATIRYLRAGAGPRRLCHDARPMCEAGLAPGDDPHRARYLLEQLGLTGEEDPARLSGGEARRAALARVLAPAARHPAARRADQPSRPAGDRMARERTGGVALRAGADQPRSALPARSCRARPCGSTAA